MLCDSEEPALAFGGPVAAVSNIVAVEQVQAIPTSVLFHTFAHLLQLGHQVIIIFPISFLHVAVLCPLSTRLGRRTSNLD